jgi:tape measure domain-containing protein
MSSKAIAVTVSDNIANSISKKLDKIASSAQKAQKNLDLLKKIINSFNRDPFKKHTDSMFKFTDSIKSATNGSTILTRAINDLNNSFKRAQGAGSVYANQLKSIKSNIIEVNNASMNATNNQQQLTERLKFSSSITPVFTRGLKTLARAINFNELPTCIASLADFKAQLDNTTGSSEASYETMKSLMELAKGTHTSFEQTAESFLSNSSALKDLGYSTDQQLMYTEALNNALAASSITGERATDEMSALQKAMVMGKLSGAELTTIIENGGYVAEVLAKQLGISTDKLSEAGQQGKITTDVIMNSFSNYYDMLQQKANDMPITISGAFTNLKTGIQECIFEIDNSIGATDKMTQVILWLSNSVKSAADSLAVLATGYNTAEIYNILFLKAVEMISEAVLKATAKIIRLNLALLANPFGLILVAITAVIAALVLFSDKIKIPGYEMITLKDVAITVWGDIKEFVSKAMKSIGKMWDWLVKSIDEKLNDMPFSVSDVFNSIIDVIKFQGNWIVRTIMLMVSTCSFVFNNLGDAWEIVWKSMARFAGAIVENVLNSWQLLFRGAAKMLSYFDADIAKSLTDKLDEWTIKIDTPEFSESAKKAKTALFDEYKNILSTDYLGNFFDGLSEGLTELLERTKNRKIAEGTGLNPPPDDNNELTGTKPVQDLTKEYDKLFNSLKPMRGALQEFSNDLNQLNKIYETGSISASEYSEYITLLANKYEASVDPLGYYNKELNRQWNLMKLSSEQRTIENELYRVNQEMMNKGLVLSQAQKEDLRQKIQLNEEYVRILAVKDSLESNSYFKKNQDFNDFVQALKGLEDNENFEYQDFINALNSDSRSPFAGMFDGSWEIMSAQISQFQKMYEQIDVLTEQFNLDQSIAASLRAQVWAKQNDIILSQADNFFGKLAQMQNSNNATMARIGKAAAIAQAVINTYQAANAAYASMAGIPYIGPALGAAAAATAIAAGMANVASIRSQSTGFMTGGYTGDIARDQIAGFVHGQEFVMNAATTQRIGVSNLEALQRGDMSSLQLPQVVNNYSQTATQESTPQDVSPIINIALVSDYESAEQWLSTQEGAKQIMQINRENSEELATIVSAS